MIAHFPVILLFGASAVLAGPLVPRQPTTVTVTQAAAAPTTPAWDAGAVYEYNIHASCNKTQHAYIRKGLEETMKLCSQARDHILRWGNSSEIYRKYFGNAPTGEPLGWFTKIVDGDKSEVLFRCDNPDGNCNNQGRWKVIIQRVNCADMYNRMGWTLAWLKCDFGDGDLRSVLRDPQTSGRIVHVRL